MATKDITDAQVVRAYVDAAAKNFTVWPCDLLEAMTRQPRKVCCAAIERACRRGLLDYGVSQRTAWVTTKGKALLDPRAQVEP